MMVWSLTRFAAQGWIERIFVEPNFFFKYPGFEWTHVWAPTGLYIHFFIVGIAALCIALGLFYRIATWVFFLGFTYIQLLDVTLYLNHYYLVILISFWLCWLPLNRQWSLDLKLGLAKPSHDIAAWIIYLFRFQIAVVYFYAGLAKAQPDWLLWAQPLNIWFNARTEIPVLGYFFHSLWIAYIFSWSGFLYDLTIWIFLFWRKTRLFAYLLVLIFHGITAALFDIGMFPIIMIVSTTIFFEPSWPQKFLHFLGIASSSPTPTTNNNISPFHQVLITSILFVYCSVQVLMPLRHFAYSGEVIWNEVGMRYAWKVMVREKNGSITYFVEQPSGRRYQVTPLDYLTWRQYSDMSGQPDLIVQLGKYIAWEFNQKGLGPVKIFVEAKVSLNGRKPALIIDPNIDITTIEPNHWGAQSWILPMPQEPPIQIK